MNNNIIHIFLSSFFDIFNANIYNYKVNGKKVTGTILWKDENEIQSFSWITELNESILLKLKLLCEYLKKNNLIKGDRIIITEGELHKLLSETGWNISEAQKMTDYLLSIEIKMIDDGEETDSFFIHF